MYNYILWNHSCSCSFNPIPLYLVECLCSKCPYIPVFAIYLHENPPDYFVNYCRYAIIRTSYFCVVYPQYFRLSCFVYDIIIIPDIKGFHYRFNCRKHFRPLFIKIFYSFIHSAPPFILAPQLGQNLNTLFSIQFPFS